MNLRAIQRLRSKLRADESTLGLWVTLESPSITEIAVGLGLDWVVIDAEHGHLDWNDLAGHIRATVRSDTVALVRIAERNTALSKRVLDIGADGIVIPWIESVEQLQEAVRDCRYPLAGRRGIGGERATVWGQCLREHTADANDHVLVVPIIESVAAIEAVPAMCRLDGVEMFLFGPADFSSSAGYAGQWEGPGVAEQILQLKDTIRAAGKNCGLMSTSVANLLQRRDQGFRILGLGADAALILRSLHECLGALGKDRMPATSFDEADCRPVVAPLAQLPESVRPNRDEALTRTASASSVEIQAGVSLMPTVARGLLTGIVTFQPGAFLDQHRHPGSESITVLEGELDVSVEGRTYRLGPLDNITIPRWVPHAPRNASATSLARAHVALAMNSPEREIVSRAFETIAMPNDSAGVPGFERVTRIKTAKRLSTVGTGASFIDYFNAKLMPGIEMSGGYARFDPEGRLPAHIHDFDESICIIDGAARCIVEGRPYDMANCDTAMVPRGRVHYFINQSNASMGMVWVYAGPMPERTVVEESLATAEGCPWR